MMKRLTGSLTYKLVVLFLLVSLVPLGIVGYMSFSRARSMLKEQEYNALYTKCKLRKQRILSYLERVHGEVELMARSNDVIGAFKQFKTYHDKGGGTPGGEFLIESDTYKAIRSQIHPYFKDYVSFRHYDNVLMMCADHGHVMYTVTGKKDLGTNLSNGPYKDSGLSRLWQEVVKSQKTRMVDYMHYTPSGKPAAFIGTPIKNKSGEVAGVLALQLSPDRVNSIMKVVAENLNQSLDIYLVGEDKFMRSDSRFGGRLLKTKVDTAATRSHGQAMEKPDIIENYKGESVISASLDTGLSERLDTDFSWTVVAEITTAEAFKHVDRLARTVMWIGVAAAVMVLLAAYFVAGGIARPIREISEQVAKMGEGDLTIKVSSKSSAKTDEVGILARGFQTTIDSLRKQTGEILHASQVIASSSAENSTMIAQITAGTTETATAVNETTSTVEELKQATQLNSEKAKGVSEGSRQTADIAQSGVDSMDRVSEEMNRIKTQMDAIAMSVMNLSEQTLAIDEIIGTVDDLAEQSNLLAVNAAVEAARAGEHGKGFAVVAQEIKSLAKQSKESTKRVRTILNDIQKANSATVMATEQGGKAVKIGADSAEKARGAIQEMLERAEMAADAATQIAASSHQQTEGVDHVASAMENIHEASNQNVDSMRQLEEATRNLNQLGTTLRELMERYKV